MTQNSPQHRSGTTSSSQRNVSSMSSEPRPARLTKSLIWPLLALHILTSVLGMVTMQAQDAAEYFAQLLPPAELAQLDPAMLETMLTATVAFFIGFSVLNIVVFVIIGLGLRANRNWARFVGLILAILFLLSAAYTLLFATDYGNLPSMELFSTIISWVIVLITLWWMIQAFDKRTTAWFWQHRKLQG